MYPGKWAARTPHKPAVIIAETGDVTTYDELEDRSVRLSRVLAEAGLGRGDVVAVLSDNDPRVFEVYWAALRSGMWLTAVNHHLAREEAAYIVQDCGAKALVVAASKATVAETVAGETPDVVVRLAFGGPVNGYGSYEAALAAAQPVPLDNQPRGAEMLYSSGTTGRPKGVRLPLPDDQVDEGAVQLVDVCRDLFGMSDRTVYLSPAPIYHAAPLRHCSAVHSLGGTVVMMRRFDAAETLAAIERYRVTAGQFVPTMFVRMLKLDDATRRRHDLSSLSLAIHAAAPCPVDVKRKMIDWWGRILVEYYASTEGIGLTMIDSDEWLAHPGSVGRSKIGVIHICDDDGAELATGEIGTVYFEREAMPFEYHNDPTRTKETQHPHHPLWLTVGDVGYVDPDDYLYLTDRKAFMIISGGVNIYPQETENVLLSHPAIVDAGVVGIPDEEMGESVKAFVQLADGIVGNAELEHDIIRFVRDRIAHYKAPTAVEFVTQLPRTPTGKMVKGELKALHARTAP